MLLAEIYKELDYIDKRILLLLDKLLIRYEYVPLSVIEGSINVPPRELALRLGRLSEMKLIKRSLTSRTGYRLTFLGLDCLALDDLVRDGVIAYLGSSIGMGKESEVYIAKSSKEALLAVKFYRIGKASFQKVSRVRQYLTNERSWLIRSKLAAEREYSVLSELPRYTENVPRAYGWSRHAVVMSFINGVELYRCRELRKPTEVLYGIFNALRAAFIHLGIVHSDLSEYNVVVSIVDEVPYIIDWPQYVYRDNPLHLEYLKRDVLYVIKFFKRRYGVSIDVGKALRFVKGEVNEVIG